MSYYYCTSCDKKFKLEYENRHFKTKLHMDSEVEVINEYTITNPELCEINNILKRHVNN